MHFVLPPSGEFWAAPVCLLACTSSGKVSAACFCDLLSRRCVYKGCLWPNFLFCFLLFFLWVFYFHPLCLQRFVLFLWIFSDLDMFMVTCFLCFFFSLSFFRFCISSLFCLFFAEVLLFCAHCYFPIIVKEKIYIRLTQAVAGCGRLAGQPSLPQQGYMCIGSSPVGCSFPVDLASITHWLMLNTCSTNSCVHRILLYSTRVM